VDILKPLSHLRKALAALRAAGGQNLSAALCRLARTKPDFPLPLDLGRLPCHLHDYSSPLDLKSSEYYIKNATILSSLPAGHPYSGFSGSKGTARMQVDFHALF
jgi:hypothetical protein